MKNISLYLTLWLLCTTQSALSQFEPTDAETTFAVNWVAKTDSDSSDLNRLVATMFAQRHDLPELASLLSGSMGDSHYEILRYSTMSYDCLLKEATDTCVDTNFPDVLVQTDAENIMPYIYSIIENDNNNNKEAALQALVKANRSTITNDYYFDKVVLVRQVLKQSAYPPKQVNDAAEVLAGAKQLYEMYLRLRSICKTESAVSTDWKHHCLSLGRRLEIESKTAFQYVFGLSIQLNVLDDSSTGREEKLAVDERRKAFGALRDTLAKQVSWWSDRSMKPDQIYQSIQEIGEVQTYQKVYAELQAH